MECRHGPCKREQKKSGVTSADNDTEAADIERLLGIATGCIGMSHDDFCRCTPSEFYATWHEWRQWCDRQDRLQWERTRTECLCMLQSHTKHRLAPEDVMTFSWDKTPELQPTEKPHLSHEEEMRRYRDAIKRYGLK